MSYGLGIVGAFAFAIVLQIFRKNETAAFLLVFLNFGGGLAALGAAVAWVLSAKAQAMAGQEALSTFANLWAANFAYASALLVVVPYCVSLFGWFVEQMATIKAKWAAMNESR